MPDVIYNPKIGYAYVPIPKNGCTAIKQAIGEHLGIENARNGEEEPDFGEFALNGREAMILDRSVFRFAFSRNPLDRVLSCWADKCSLPIRDPHAGPRLLRWAGRPFVEFAEAVCNTPDDESDIHVRSQYLFLMRWGIWIVDAVFSFANLPRQWKWLQHRYELPPLAVLRASDHRPYWECYTVPLAERVRERFASDYELLGYEAEWLADLERIRAANKKTPEALQLC